MHRPVGGQSGQAGQRAAAMRVESHPPPASHPARASASLPKLPAQHLPTLLPLAWRAGLPFPPLPATALSPAAPPPLPAGLNADAAAAPVTHTAAISADAEAAFAHLARAVRAIEEQAARADAQGRAADSGALRRALAELSCVRDIVLKQYSYKL
mmetsp:Transcript_14160/g.36009  ORF Transcript_14160/g.36009 Transcript_14160/m.36009 type:complete len:155 (+) Transcript_14160:170-634(+)